MKIHERDCHDTWDCTKSISPPPNRKKRPSEIFPNQKKVEEHEIVDIVVNDLVNEAVDKLEVMELNDEIEMKKISDQMDKKIIDKRKRDDIKEEERIKDKPRKDYIEEVQNRAHTKPAVINSTGGNVNIKEHQKVKEGVPNRRKILGIGWR